MASTRTSDEDMACLEDLSDTQIPETEVDLIGPLQCTELLIGEYAQADSIYQAKVLSLSRTFARYRKIKGDGNCGWRAVAFAYFEALQRLGDPEKLHSEEGRLRSFNNLLKRTGYDEYTFEGFADETFDLLRMTASELPCQDSGKALLKAFNDFSTSSSVVTHFRLIASAWMASNVDAYQPFLLEQTVDEYRATTIDPYQVEMEEPGLRAVYDAIVKPAGIDLDIAYLDRSFGSEVTVHSWQADDDQRVSVGSSRPTIRMLYKIGHFDLLYRSEDFFVRLVPFVQTPYLELDRTYGYQPHDDNRVPDTYCNRLTGDTPKDKPVTKISTIMWPDIKYVLPGLSSDDILASSIPYNPFLDVEQRPGSLGLGVIELDEPPTSPSQLSISIGLNERSDGPFRYSGYMRGSVGRAQLEQRESSSTDEFSDYSDYSNQSSNL